MEDSHVWEVGDRVTHINGGYGAATAILVFRHVEGGSNFPIWLVRMLSKGGLYHWREDALLPEPPLEALARALRDTP